MIGIALLGAIIATLENVNGKLAHRFTDRLDRAMHGRAFHRAARRDEDASAARTAREQIEQPRFRRTVPDFFSMPKSLRIEKRSNTARSLMQRDCCGERIKFLLCRVSDWRRYRAREGRFDPEILDAENGEITSINSMT